MTHPRLLRYAGLSRKTLAANAEHGFAARYALCHFGANAVYSFIPKNACSTLRVSLALANGAIGGLEQWTWIHHNNPTFRASLRDLATARFTFVILRCPHARLASVFLNKIVGRQPEYWQLFRALGDGIDPASFTFRDFVEMVTGDKDDDADETGKDAMDDPMDDPMDGGAGLRLNEHWCPQTDFLVYENYDAWYAVERMAEARADLADRIGLDLVDARPLTRHGTDRFTLLDAAPGGGSFADMSLAELAGLQARGQAPAHAALYDDTLARAVARTYAEDLALYASRIGPDTLTFPTIEIDPKEI
ncbi:MAG: hypothetical protein CML68_06420 [Rhodobacteraceae bacterium]|nr:hypothetical protein [Paracoccaceae bacterium]